MRITLINLARTQAETLICQISGRTKQTGLISHLRSPLNNNSPFFVWNTFECECMLFILCVCLLFSWIQRSTPLHLTNKLLCQKNQRKEKLHFTSTIVVSLIKLDDKTIEAAQNKKQNSKKLLTDMTAAIGLSVSSPSVYYPSSILHTRRFF